MANPLFATKPLSLLLEEMKGENRLRRVLGPVQLTSLGVGAIIGAGIFVATGAAAHNVAGPALMLSFVVAGITCVFAALCYAEFASMVPVAGSAYTYAYATLGRVVRLDHRLGPGAGVRRRQRDRGHGWSGYFQNVLVKLGLSAARWPCASRAVATTTSPPGTSSPPDSIINLPAIVIVGHRHGDPGEGHPESATFNATMVGIKLAAVLFVIGVGVVLRQPGQLAPVRALRLDRHQLLRPPRGGPDRPAGRAARHARGRGDHLLRLHRLRLGLDPRRGGARARSATCPSASSPRC